MNSALRALFCSGDFARAVLNDTAKYAYQALRMCELIACELETQLTVVMFLNVEYLKQGH